MNLDREVAEKIMGWTNVRFLPGGNVLFGCPDDDYNQDYPNNKHTIPVPSYSRDMNSAFMIVKQMRELGWLLCVEDTTAWFYRNDLSFAGDAHKCESLCEAICRAALSAIKEAP